MQQSSHRWDNLPTQIDEEPIADDVVIGANAVVTKDIAEPGITVAGIPAKKISNCGSYHYLNR